MNLTSHQIGFYIVVITTIHLIAFWWNNRKSIHAGLKGEDGKYQAIEIISYLTCVIWPNMIMADQFFGFKASTEAWTSINLIIFVAVLGISYDKFLKHKANQSDQDVTISRKTETTVEKKVS